MPTPARLVPAIRGPSFHYKRAEMQAISDRMDECAPLLVALLAEAADDPAAFEQRDGPETRAVVYATALVAWHRVDAAHEPLLALCRHPDEQVELLLCDATAEGLGPWLFATAGGRGEGILDLLDHPRLGEWVGFATVVALGLLIDAGSASQASASQASDSQASVDQDLLLQRLQRLLRQAEGTVLSAALWTALALGRAELRQLVVQAMVSDRIDPWDYIPLGRLDEYFTGDRRPDFLHDKLEQALPADDLLDVLGWWACFADQQPCNPSARNASVARECNPSARSAAVASEGPLPPGVSGKPLRYALSTTGHRDGPARDLGLPGRAP